MRSSARRNASAVCSGTVSFASLTAGDLPPDRGGATVPWSGSADLVTVGSGFYGLTVAERAARNGARVAVLDRRDLDMHLAIPSALTAYEHSVRPLLHAHRAA